MKNQSRSIGLLVEGPDDDRTVQRLCDALFHIDSCEFVGISSGRGSTYWRNVIHEVRERRIPPRHGHFGDKPGVEDARLAVLALRCFQLQDAPPRAVMLVRDSDGKPKERREGLEQAENDFSWPFDIVIGIAVVSANAPRFTSSALVLRPARQTRSRWFALDAFTKKWLAPFSGGSTS
jgi:hypothetical protein